MNNPYIGLSHYGPPDTPDTADADEAFREHVTTCVEGGFGFWALDFAENNQECSMKEEAKLKAALIRWYRYGDEDGLRVYASLASEQLDRYIAEKLKKETV